MAVYVRHLLAAFFCVPPKILPLDMDFIYVLTVTAGSNMKLKTRWGQQKEPMLPFLLL